MNFSYAYQSTSSLNPLIPKGTKPLVFLGINSMQDNAYMMMHGSGVLDIASSIFEKVKDYVPGLSAAQSLGSKAIDAYSSELGNKVTDFISSKLSDNPNARPGFKGEKHVFLNTPYGFTKANFAGPGTQIVKRLQRGDKGISQIDSAAKKHDIDYHNAKTKKDIRDADNIFIKRIRDATDASDLQKNIVIAAIKAKTIGEDIGLFDVETFTKLPGLKGSGIMSDMELDALIQRIKPSPGQFLKSDVIKQIKKKLNKKRRQKGGRYYKKPLRPRSMLMKQHKDQCKGGNLRSIAPFVIKQIAEAINQRKEQYKRKKRR